MTKVRLSAEGRKPSAVARRHVYGALAARLRADVEDPVGVPYLTTDLETEADRRRAVKAARRVLADLEKRAKV